MKTRISLSLDESLVRQIDEIRGLIPRSAIIEALLKVAIRDYLFETGEWKRLLSEPLPADERQTH